MLTPIKAIRAKCLECTGGCPKEVRKCGNVECALYLYRMGKNPNRKGMGQVTNLVKQKLELSEPFSEKNGI